MNKIRTVVVDDDPFVRMSLQTILDAQDDIEICALGGSGEEAVDLDERERPDVLLMDIQMPGMGGLDAAELATPRHPRRRPHRVLDHLLRRRIHCEGIAHRGEGGPAEQEVATIAPALRAVVAGQNVLGTEVLDRMGCPDEGGDDACSSVLQRFFRRPLPCACLPKRAALCVPAGVSAGRKRKACTGRETGERTCGGHAMTGTPASGQASSQELTERERAIVELVAEGMDNKEIAATLFLSEGTVRNHISAILQKLGLKNRTQLAIAYYRAH